MIVTPPEYRTRLTGHLILKNLSSREVFRFRDRLLLGFFSSLGNGFEGSWFVDGQLAQNLAVKCDVNGFQAGYQLAVRSAVQACSSVDAGVPQGAETALLVAAVAVGELQRLSYGLPAALDAGAVRVRRPV